MRQYASAHVGYRRRVQEAAAQPVATEGVEAPVEDAATGVASVSVDEATGVASVDAALERLRDVEHAPVEAHVEIFDDVQRRLHDALAELDDGQ
jgi:hypothetical protein